MVDHAPWPCKAGPTGELTPSGGCGYHAPTPTHGVAAAMASDLSEYLDLAAASRLTRDNQYDSFRGEVRRESAAAVTGRTGDG